MLVFVASDGIHGPELWKSNGTQGGTVPFTPTSASDPEQFTARGCDDILQG